MIGDFASRERSIERSYLRLRVLLVLASLTEAFPRQLAKACGIDCWRLDQVLYGDDADYRSDLALVTLGLVEVHETSRGTVLRVTRAGARKARQLAARQHRRDRFREQNRAAREMRGERAEPRAWPRVDRPDNGPVVTPVGDTRSFRWAVEE